MRFHPSITRRLTTQRIGATVDSMGPIPTANGTRGLANVQGQARARCGPTGTSVSSAATYYSNTTYRYEYPAITASNSPCCPNSGCYTRSATQRKTGRKIPRTRRAPHPGRTHGGNTSRPSNCPVRTHPARRTRRPPYSAFHRRWTKETIQTQTTHCSGIASGRHSRFHL